MLNHKKKILVIALGSVLIAILIVYFCMAIFFMYHFQFNTKINGEDVSLKTIGDAEFYLESLIEPYKLTIVGNNNIKEEISGKSISIKLKKGEALENILKKHEAFLWPISLFREDVKKIDIKLTYDKDKLEQEIKGLKIISAEANPGEDARPEFDGEKYVIVPEVYAINQEKFTEKVQEYIGRLETTLDVKAEDCYIAPRYTAESKEVQTACDIMNKYIQSSITYTKLDQVIIDKTLISQWIFVDANMNVHINIELIRNWLTELGDKYDTIGTTRTFTTPTGKNATVSGGTYGWSINEDTEFGDILDHISTGESITKDLAYYNSGVAAEHGMPDWGNTYIEVDLTEQYMWYISDGNIVFQSDVITGKPIPEKITPEGVYSILDKRLDYILTGAIDPATGKPLYRTHVDYWMRVTWTGIGFHDADWQSAFGGNLYQSTAGSHGCINMPVDKAGEFYNMIENGTPVIIHY
ncbi:MAG: L,D-transpeptidase family protein [Lachnospiraceae bacterium]